MASEHNPISQLVNQIQKKWIDDVTPYSELKLVRWLIKPEEARLYEGFLRLESTEHGALPEVLVALLTPFKSEEAFSFELINDWIKAYTEDKKTQEKLVVKGITKSWNYQDFTSPSHLENGINISSLVKMLLSFRNEMMNKDSRLILAFFPHAIHDFDGFNRWLISLLRTEIPSEIVFMIFDHQGENYFDRVFEKFPAITKSLHVNLDLNGAINKIAKMGNPNSPEVKLRECILEMGQSVQNNNEKRLHEWGEKALLVTKRSGVKSMFSSAHIIYAGMLFTFKRYDKIDYLLTLGLNIAKQGLKTGDVSCKPLIIQFYGYLASSNHLQKKYREAISVYEKQGDAAFEFELPAMSLMPYQQAYTLSKKHLSERYDELIQKAFKRCRSISDEELLNSSFSSIALDYIEWLKEKQLLNDAVKTDNELSGLFGNDWKEKTKNTGISYSNNTTILNPVN